MATFMPSVAKASAIASPMPVPPPTTNAFCPLKFIADELSRRLYLIQHLLALTGQSWQTRQISIRNESDFMKMLNPTHSWTALFSSLLLGLLLVPPIAADDKAGKAKAGAKVVHHLTLRGAYSERPGTSLDLASLVMGGGLSSKSYFKLVEHVEALAKDDEVDCVVLDLSQPFMLGKVNTRDFAARIANLNAAGKRTIAWGGSVDTATLGVAAACSEIFMSSDGMGSFRPAAI